EPPRFHIGDWVKFDYGPKKVSAMIVEDRGLLGIQGRRLYRVQLDKELGEASTFEVPENELETELPPVRLSYEVKYIRPDNTNVWHASTRKEVHPAEARAGVEKNGHADSNWSCVIRNSAPTQEVSMSTSLLYHAFGIRGYRYTRTDYQGGQVIFTIHQEPENCRCSACGSTQVVSRGQVERRFRALPI